MGLMNITGDVRACGDTQDVQAQEGLALVNAMHVSNGG